VGLLATVQEAGRAPGPVWTGAENLAPTGIRYLQPYSPTPRNKPIRNSEIQPQFSNAPAENVAPTGIRYLQPSNPTPRNKTIRNSEIQPQFSNAPRRKCRPYRNSISPTFQPDSSEQNNSEFRDTTTNFECPPQKMSPLPGFDLSNLPTRLLGKEKQFGIRRYNHNFPMPPAENVAPTGIRSLQPSNPTPRNKTIRNSEIQPQISNAPPQKMSPLPGFDLSNLPTRLLGSKQFGIQRYNHNFRMLPAENVAPTGIRSLEPSNPTPRNKTIRNSEVQPQFSNAPRRKCRPYRDSISPTFQPDSSEKKNNSEFRDTITIFERPPQKMSPLPGFDLSNLPTRLLGTKQFGIQRYNHNFRTPPAENVAPTGIR